MLLRVLIIIALVLIAAIAVLYFFGRRMQNKQSETQKQIDQVAQQATILVIDKKKMRLKNANLPQVVMDSAPKMAKLAKMPIVKAKIGPKVLDLLCDEKVFDELPVKKECKVMLSGMYITSLKSVRGGMPTAPQKKKGLFKR